MAEQRGPARGSNSGNRNPGQSRGKGASQEGPPRGKGASSRSGRPPRDGDGRDGGRDGRPSRDGGSRGRDGGRDDRPRRDGDSRGRDGGRDGERRSGARGLRGDGREAPPEAGPRSWGGLARRGAARINEDQSLHEPELEADDQPPSEKDDPEGFAKHEARMAKRALGDANRERLRNEAQAAIARSEAKKPVKRKPRAKKVPEALERRPLAPHKLPDPKRQLKDLLGDSAGGRAWRDLNQAAEDIEDGRSGQARVLAERLYRRAPEVIEVAEMYGLALYGQGKWRQTVEVLELVRESSGLPDQNPVLADAHRALGNYADVEALWAELREASPANDLLNEGRIVAAGALGDQGRLQDAVRLLSKGWKRPKRPLDHHLRRAYALADLYERAGERPQAKELFGWIAHHEPLYGDAKQRSQ